MTTEASAMDVETARRILARVPHSQRFPVGRFVPPVGLLGSSVRSLEELALALRPEKQSLAGVDLKRLAEWIDEHVGDPASAASVRDAARGAASYVEACALVYQRIAERVAAAHRVTGTASIDGLAVSSDEGRRS